MTAIGRIVSGGQSGVDRAALDAAIAAGIPYGGWCPRGGWAEDLPDPPGLLALYPGLRETPAGKPAQRTRWNVRDSDATMILVPGGPPPPASGTALTLASAQELGRLLGVLDLGAPRARERGLELIGELAPGAVLNIAGARESGAPGIYQRARGLLADLLAAR